MLTERIIQEKKLLVATRYYTAPKYTDDKALIARSFNSTVVNDNCFAIIDPAWNTVWLFIKEENKEWEYLKLT